MENTNNITKLAKKNLASVLIAGVTLGIAVMSIFTVNLVNKDRNLNPDKSFAGSFTPTPIASPTPVPASCNVSFVVATVTPTPGKCTTVTPSDPPHGICSTNGTTGSAFWEWHPVPEATQYEVDIYRSNGTLFINNDWQNSSVYNCQVTTNKCTYITNNMPLGQYYSRVRARGTCMESNWHQSITITVAVCPLTTATPTPKL